MAAIGGRELNKLNIQLHPNFTAKITIEEAVYILKRVHAKPFIIREMAELPGQFAISFLKNNQLFEYKLEPQEKGFLLKIPSKHGEKEITQRVNTLEDALSSIGLDKEAEPYEGRHMGRRRQHGRIGHLGQMFRHLAQQRRGDVGRPYREDMGLPFRGGAASALPRDERGARDRVSRAKKAGAPEVGAWDEKEVQDILEQRERSRGHSKHKISNRDIHDHMITHHPLYRSGLTEKEQELEIRDLNLPYLLFENPDIKGSYQITWLTEHGLAKHKGVSIEPSELGFNLVLIDGRRIAKKNLQDTLNEFGFISPELNEWNQMVEADLIVEAQEALSPRKAASISEGKPEVKSMTFKPGEADKSKAPAPHWPLTADENKLIAAYLKAVPENERQEDMQDENLEGLGIDPITFNFMTDPITLTGPHADPKNKTQAEGEHTFDRKTLEDLLAKKSPAADPLNPNFLFTEKNFGPPKEESKQKIQALLVAARAWVKEQKPKPRVSKGK